MVLVQAQLRTLFLSCELQSRRRTKFRFAQTVINLVPIFAENGALERTLTCRQHIDQLPAALARYLRVRLQPERPPLARPLQALAEGARVHAKCCLRTQAARVAGPC